MKVFLLFFFVVTFISPLQVNALDVGLRLPVYSGAELITTLPSLVNNLNNGPEEATTYEWARSWYLPGDSVSEVIAFYSNWLKNNRKLKNEWYIDLPENNFSKSDCDNKSSGIVSRIIANGYTEGGVVVSTRYLSPSTCEGGQQTHCLQTDGGWHYGGGLFYGGEPCLPGAKNLTGGTVIDTSYWYFDSSGNTTDIGQESGGKQQIPADPGYKWPSLISPWARLANIFWNSPIGQAINWARNIFK